jgi:hypothetical protein
VYLRLGGWRLRGCVAPGMRAGCRGKKSSSDSKCSGQSSLMRRPAKQLRWHHAAGLEFVWNKCVLSAVRPLTQRRAGAIEQCEWKPTLFTGIAIYRAALSGALRSPTGNNRLRSVNEAVCKQVSRSIVLFAMVCADSPLGRTNDNVCGCGRAGSRVQTHAGSRDSASTGPTVSGCPGCDRGTNTSANQSTAGAVTHRRPPAMGVTHKPFITTVGSTSDNGREISGYRALCWQWQAPTASHTSSSDGQS